MSESRRTGLAPHPRLYIGRPEIQRLKIPADTPLLRECAHAVERMSGEFEKHADFKWELNTHNAHLIRARMQQVRVVTLLIQWLRTGEKRWRDSAMAHLRAMSRWDVWSWITWRGGNREPEAIFDLSYGENSATLALAWDLLHGTLEPEEADLLLGMARKWSVPAFLKHTAAGSEMWWYRPEKADCNWLAVCAGGAGLLGLAMAEELPEAEEIIGRAERGVCAFMDTLEKTDGGWGEGVAYWNYGMRYAFGFLLSWERALGRKHPALDRDSTRKTLRFPVDFAPYGMACGFGDIGDARWRPVAAHYAAAERTGSYDLIAALDRVGGAAEDHSWPTAAELLALHPHKPAPSGEGIGGRAVRLYSGIGWARMADERWPEPRFYVSIRGGHTHGPHNSADLLSWHALVNGERVVWSCTNHEYLDTTFSDRRWELAEMRPDTKNTILIGGVGMRQPGETVTEQIEVAGHSCIRIEATQAYGAGDFGRQTIIFVGRLFVWLDGVGLAILDSVELAHPNRIETRIHTASGTALDGSRAVIRSGRSILSLAFACSVPAVLAESLAASTNPNEKPARVIRWAARGLECRAAFATVAAPGSEDVFVEIQASEEGLRVEGAIGDRRIGIPVSWRLRPCDLRSEQKHA